MSNRPRWLPCHLKKARTTGAATIQIFKYLTKFIKSCDDKQIPRFSANTSFAVLGPLFIASLPVSAEAQHTFDAAEAANVVILDRRNQTQGVELRVPSGYGILPNSVSAPKVDQVLSFDCRRLFSRPLPTKAGLSSYLDCSFPIQSTGHPNYIWRLDIENRVSSPLNLGVAANFRRRSDQAFIVKNIDNKALAPFSYGYIYVPHDGLGRREHYESRRGDGAVDALIDCNLDSPNPSCRETFEIPNGSHLTVSYQFPYRMLRVWPKVRRSISTLIESFYIGRMN